jgi:hypothetical protein
MCCAGWRLGNLKLSEARKTSSELRAEVADFLDVVCLGNMPYREVSLLRRF